MINTYRKEHPGLFWLIVIGSISILLFSIGSTIFIKDEYSLTVISDISSPVLNLFATVALFFAAKQSISISKRLAIGWGVLSLAQLTFTLGDIFWAVLELGQHTYPFPSIADIAYLLYYLIFFIGIMVFPFERFRPAEWVKRTLDMGIIMIGAIIMYDIYICVQFFQ